MTYSREAKNPQFAVPESLESAFVMRAREHGTVYLAGGTDIMPLIRNGILRPVCLVDLESVKQLKGIHNRDEGIFVGAMTELGELSESHIIKKGVPAVAEAAGHVASPQIRNVATVGGNLLQEKRCLYLNQSEFWRENVTPCYRFKGEVCYQMPGSQDCRAIYYSDLAPILIAYEAKAVFFDGKKHQEWPVEEMVHRHCHEALENGLLEGILIPHAQDGSLGIFMKYGVRQAIDFAFSSVGIRYTPGLKNRQPDELKIMVGAVAPEPVRLEETEKEVLKALNDKVPAKDSIYASALKEVQSRSSLIREFTVSMKGKRNALLIVADALRTFFEKLER